MNRLKLRRNVPAPLTISKDSSGEPQFHNRPLSLHGDEIQKDTLEALLDVMPSRSLPATPLAKKRSDHINLSPPESPAFDKPPSPPAIMTTVPVVEINYHPPVESTDPTVESGYEKPLSNTGSNGVELPAQEQVSSVEPEQTSAANLNNEVQKILTKEYTWDKVREVLQEADKNHCALDISYDVLPKDDEQEWLQHLNGIEQLRAFLAVCD